MPVQSQPAFPSGTFNRYSGESVEPQNFGMSERAMIAMHIMSGLVSRDDTVSSQRVRLAKEAVELADALLAELEK